MRTFFIVSSFLVVILARPFPKGETIELEGIGSVSVTKLLEMFFPNSAGKVYKSMIFIEYFDELLEVYLKIQKVFCKFGYNV